MDLIKLKKIREQRNKDVVKRMKQGDSLVLVTMDQILYPPRPALKKDKDAIRRLYSLGPKLEK